MSDSSLPKHSWSLSGWDEAVIFIAQGSRLSDFLSEFGGWTQVYEGPLDDRLLRFWNLSTETFGIETVLSAPDHSHRYIRLIELTPSSQVATRVDSQPWDSGGIFDLNVRVKDLESHISTIRGWGWQALCPPLRFTFGQFEVVEWVIKDSSGVTLALIERLSPPLDSPHFEVLSAAFNSTQIVADFDRAYAFYTEVLGFQSYLSHQGTSQPLGQNVFGLPREVALTIERKVEILHPQGLNVGSIELISFEGLHGEDRSAYGAPPLWG